MADSNVAALQSERSNIESEISSTESQRSWIDAELTRVTAAKEAVGSLKGEARDLRRSYGKDAISYIEGNWNARYMSRFYCDNYSDADDGMGRYIRALDHVHDELITKEHQLTVERNSLDGRLIDLRNAWSWVTSNLEKLFN